MDEADDEITTPAPMTDRAARMLDGLDERFYAEQATSFSQTRTAPWPGWRRCLSDALQGFDALGSSGSPDASERADRPLRVLDVGCGNQRFCRWLASPQGALAELGGRAVDYLGVDREAGLLAQGPTAADLPAGWHARRRRLDIVAALADGTARDILPRGDQDLTVAFGLFHHIPTRTARNALMEALAGTLAPGGACCVSLWRFMDDPRLASRARAATGEGLAALGLAQEDLEPGDHLLGWQGRPGAWRYCHHFSGEEADELAGAAAGMAALADRFASDGRSGGLNEYLVLRRLPPQP